MTTGRVTEKRIIRRRCTQVSLKNERQRKQEEGLCSVNAAGDCSFVNASVT
jgi:hypothetical protein